MEIDLTRKSWYFVDDQTPTYYLDSISRNFMYLLSRICGDIELTEPFQ